MRVAIRYATSERIGYARHFVEVSDFSDNRLTLSGIVLRGSNQPAENKAAGAGAPQGAAAPAAGRADDTGYDPQSEPAVRRMRQGMVLDYRYAVYNAQLDPATNRPQLTTQMRLFRNGKQVFAGRVLPFDGGKQTDMKRLGAGGRLRLGPELTPGDYVLQVVVTDVLAKEKRRTATQWIDFEIVG